MNDNIGSANTAISANSSTASPTTTTTSGGGGENDVTTGVATELVSTPDDLSTADGANVAGAIDTAETSYAGDAVEMDMISAPAGGDDDGMDGWVVEIVEEEDAVEPPITKMMHVDDDIEAQYVPSSSAAAQQQANAEPTERKSWVNLAAGFGIMMGAIIGLVSWLRRKIIAFVGGVSQAMQAPAPEAETA